MFRQLRRNERLLRPTIPSLVRLKSLSSIVSFSTESSSPTHQIGLTLYRQLLRWCDNPANDTPVLSSIPPVNLQAPHDVDAFRLEILATPSAASSMDDDKLERVRTLLPAHAQVTAEQLNLVVRNADDLRRLIQVVFRLNSGVDVGTNYLKERQTAAFTALKSLNELTTKIEAVERERESHRDREGVEFRIGQVVQHKDERCRGVVYEWSRPYKTKTLSSSSPKAPMKSSLTGKDYSKSFEAAGTNRTVRYNLILDVGDAHTMGSSSGWLEASQNELEAVQDEGLMRIRSSFLQENFARFDQESKLFVPRKAHGYNFPKDQPDAPPTKTLSKDLERLCDDIIDGSKALAEQLERCILDESSCPADRQLNVLKMVQSRLQRIQNGDVLSSKEKLEEPENISKLSLATYYLRELHSIQFEIVDTNLKRKKSKVAKHNLQFSIGDVVYHSHFGFRGVVIGWDAKPLYDVRRWDGLQHIKNPMDLPFYHVVPDENDCMEAFGGPRGTRYVCEANLEACSPERLESIQVDLEPDWERKSPGNFRPPPGSRFLYGADTDDDDITERCLLRFQDEFNTCHLNARLPQTDDEIASKLSMKHISSLLKAVDCQTDAAYLQEVIKEMRKAHLKRDLRWDIESAIALLMGGQGGQAMAAYKEIVQADPQYAEAWNRLATCQFMMGDNDASMESTKKVLELEPEHTHALNGAGLIHFDNENYKEAEEAFRKSISIDPWSPVSTKLSLTLDLLNQVIYRENTFEVDPNK